VGGPGSDLTSPAAQRPPILLGVTGGVAAYKACELVRLLLQAGHGVQVAVTSEAERFVGAETFSALSRRPGFGEYRSGHSAVECTELAPWVQGVDATPMKKRGVWDGRSYGSEA